MLRLVTSAPTRRLQYRGGDGCAAAFLPLDGHPLEFCRHVCNHNNGAATLVK